MIMKTHFGHLLFIFINLYHCVFGGQTISLNHVTIDTLTCHVTTEIGQSFALSWFKGNEVVSTKSYDNVKTERTSSSITLGRDAETTGTYKCVIKGPDGNLTSNSVTVKRDTPYMTISLPNPAPAMLSLRINETASIPFYVTCIVASFPTANVTFTKNGKPLQSSNHIQISSMEKGDTITHTLLLTNASYRDAAEYVCRASNGFISESMTGNTISLKGQVCSEELLATQQQYRCPNKSKCVSTISCKTIEACKLHNCERPDTPENAKIIRCTHDAAELQWTRDAKAKTYTVYIDKAGDVSKSVRTTDSDMVASGLQSNNEYMFSIVAHNDAGQSREQAYLKCRTTRLERPSRIPLTHFRHHDDGLMIFGWKLPADDGISNDKVVGKLQYQVEYCPQLTSSIGKQNTSSCKSYLTNDTSLPLKDMKANKVYKFSVMAINKGGMKGDPRIVYYTIPSNINSGANLLISNVNLLVLASIGFFISFILNMSH